MPISRLDKAKQDALKNGSSKLIRHLLLKSGHTVQDLAKMLDIKPQSLSTKLYRDRFTNMEFQMITQLLGSEMMVQMGNERFVVRDGGVVVLPVP